jgi:neutral ceramidase
MTMAGAAGLAAAGPPPAWKAGAAVVDITPRTEIWMAGFAARKSPSQGVEMPLHAKALVLEDEGGRRTVLAALDLLGVTAETTARITSAARRRYAIPREALLINTSHTHCGPVVEGVLGVAYDLDAEQKALIRRYTRELEDKVVGVIGAALKRLQPARLAFAEGQATFAANRRVQFTPGGPVDHSVPVLRIETRAGPPLAIVFGYACHNTTLQANFTKFHGDYAGVAQAALEERHPGAAALFVSGCGADANPHPRGTLELVRQHGRSLADAVDRALTSAVPIAGALRAAQATIDLPFAPVPDAEGWRARLRDENEYVRRHARLMLEILARDGQLPDSQAQPIQVWRLGDALTLVALGGEVVVDYALRLRKEYAGQRIWAAGYSNDVFGYVPSLRVLEEGGYEGGGAMLYYGRPGPFAPPVEELIHGKIRALMTATERSGDW